MTRIRLSATPIGSDLARPECVIATSDGALYVSDWRGGVTRIAADGRQSSLFAQGASLKPNGIALCANGRFLIAHLDDHEGGVFELASDGTVRPFLTEIDGRRLEPTNFVLVEEDAVWITVSTRHVPRHSARCRKVADGYIIRVDRRGTRIVADGIAFANECRVDAQRRWLYVNETYGARVSRFRIRPDGDLADRETFVTFAGDVFPDGLTFDADGALWVTSIFSNRLIRVGPDRAIDVLLDDADQAFLERFVADVDAGAIAAPGTIEMPWRRYGNLSSCAFAGSAMNQLILGCLLDCRIYRADVPVRGLTPCHWAFRAESGPGWIATPSVGTHVG